MTADPLDRLERLFRSAQMHSPEERKAFLEAACADDPALRRELDELLQADRQAEDASFLDSPGWASPQVAASENDEGLLEPREIGPYAILRRLGHGGMGDVYLAVREQPFKQYVALKIIRRGMDSREVLARFNVERQILAALNHPNVARLFDGGVTADGLPYFAMEYVDGRPITAFCDEHRLNLHDRLALFRNACQAVHYAHQNLVIHRDLKPSNILVTENGTVKLLDFGIAKLLNPSFSPVSIPITRAGLRLLTPEYASPEHLRSETLSTAADVYSLGVILYELLTGRLPHEVAGRSVQEIIGIVSEREPERPSTRIAKGEAPVAVGSLAGDDAPDHASAARHASTEQLRRQLRGDLDNITLKALRKEPARRYSSAEQLSQDIERYLSGMPVAARPNTIGYRVRKFSTRHRFSMAAAVLAILSLVGGLATSLWQADAARRERDRAEQALVQSEAVTDFLMRLFESGDPAVTQGDEITVRELLRRGVERAEEIQSQPLVQARTFDVVGRVYQSLGQYESAEELIQRGLAIRRSELGENHLLVAESMVHLGAVLTRRGRYDDAEAAIRTALAIQQDLLKRPDAAVAKTLMELGYLLPFVAKLEEAEETYRQALALHIELFGEEHIQVANTLIRVAGVLRHQGRYSDAEGLYRRALSIHQGLHQQPNSNVAWSMFQLALVLQHRQSYDDAEDLMRRGLDVERAAEGESHPSVSSFMFALGHILDEKGDSAGAEEMLRSALTMRRAVLEEHPSTADGLVFLATFLGAKNQTAEAESLFTEAIAMRRKLLGPDHFEVGVALSGLARLHTEAGRLEVAEKMFEEALVIHRKALGPDHHHVGSTMTDLARLHGMRGHVDTADSLFQAGLAILRRNQTDEHVDVQRAFRHIAEFYDTWGKPNQADTYRALIVSRPTS